MAKESRPRPRLDRAQAVGLMNACLHNAERLLNDADFLLRGARVPSSLASTLLAREEMGKSLLVFGALFFGEDEATWKRFWNRFRNHGSKQRVFTAWNLLGTAIPESRKQNVICEAHGLTTFRELVTYAGYDTVTSQTVGLGSSTTIAEDQVLIPASLCTQYDVASLLRRAIPESRKELFDLRSFLQSYVSKDAAIAMSPRLAFKLAALLGKEEPRLDELGDTDKTAALLRRKLDV
jgi:AbiV family abortive infection protein